MSVYSHWELSTRMNDKLKYTFELAITGKALSPTNPSVIAQRHSAMLRTLPRESLAQLMPQLGTNSTNQVEEEKKVQHSRESSFSNSAVNSDYISSSLSDGISKEIISGTPSIPEEQQHQPQEKISEEEQQQ
jgi:hypothetical protein